jgi:iron(III) transport system ATP-binding protein
MTERSPQRTGELEAAAPSSGPGARTPLIAVRELRKRFGGFPAVDRLTFEVGEGEILALLGPSGCGKTTTLRLIAGLERPEEGSIAIAGRVVAGGPVFVPPEARGVGLVFQDLALFPHLTVAENVAFGLRGRRRGQDGAVPRRVAEVLALVDLADLGRRYPHQLSGGQQQRVALARALAPNPQVILLDEPFSNLDADMRAQMRRDVQRILRTAGTTALFVTHDQEEACELADRIGVLNSGRLEQIDIPEALYRAPATRFVAQFVGSADFLPGGVTPEGIRTELGLFERAPQFAVGARVEVMIRPVDVHILPGPDGRGMITERCFRGSETLYTVRLPSGQIVHSSQPSANLWPPGTRVHVTATPAQLIAFAALKPWL